MLLLDLFCGAGGAAIGYHRAGFTVVGVDHQPQPRYPFEFHEADAMDYLAEHGSKFHAIHASPPCQAYSPMRARHTGKQYPALVDHVRDMLLGYLCPWVIENVSGARLPTHIQLCGTMFGLGVRRHRLFECSDLLLVDMRCRHKRGDLPPVGVYGHTGGAERRTKNGKPAAPRHGLEDWKMAMGIDWMTCEELSQAIPPAYTEWLGKHLLALVEADL
jgi:DNA (cytosine-5)-methyltransferase 1